MNIAGSLNYDTKIDTSGFQKGINKITNSAASGGTKIKTIVAGLGITKLISTAINTITNSIDDAVSRIDTLNNFPKVMSNLNISAEDSEKAINKLSDRLTGLPTALDTAALSVQRLTSKNGDVQKSVDIFLALNNAILAGGASSEIQASAVEQISQAYARGKPDMVEWRSLMTAMPAQLKQVAIAMGYVDADALGEDLRNGNIEMDAFINTMVRLNEEGVAGFKTFEEQARNATGGIKTNITNMKTAIARGLANVIQSIDKSLKKADMGGIADQINSLGKLAEKMLKSVAKALEKIDWKKVVSAIKSLIPLVGTLTTAWIAYNATLKITQAINFAKNITNIAKNFISLVSTTKSVTTAIKGLNIAMSANPVGAVVAGVTLLTGGLIALISAIKNSSKETDANTIATQNLIEKQKELNEQLKENNKTRQENITSAQEEVSNADFLFERISRLAEVEKKTNAQKNEMKRLVNELNNVMPDLNLEYNKEKDALNMSTEAMRENIAAQKDLIMAKASQENLASIAKDIAENEIEAAKASEQNTKNQKAYTKARKELLEFENKYSAMEIANSSELTKKHKELQDAKNKTKKNYEESTKSVKDYNKTLKDLNETYELTSDQANDYLDKADISKAMAKLTDKVKAAGREIPQAIQDGINSGIYAVPESLEGLDRLISFDNVLSKSKYAGEEIPRSISQGVINGEVSVEEAMKQIEKVMTLANTAQKYIDEGKAIPEDLAKGIKDGKYSLKEAQQIINQSIKFDELTKEAEEKGAKIPRGLANSIKNGKVTVEEANKMLKQSITFSELSAKAKEAGVAVPKALSDGIISGELQPKEATDRLQALIDYTKMATDADVQGKLIPKKISDGIISGEVSITEANGMMNRWIGLKTALQTAYGQSTGIPSTITTNILNGKMSIEDAVKQMNNWFKFQTALNRAGLAGTDIPKKIEQGILSGKLKPADAIKQLNDSTVREANKLSNRLKSSGKKSGEDYDQGLYNGVNNKTKRRNISDSVSLLGNAMVYDLKKSIDSNSPSKETDKIGNYYLDGLYRGVTNRNKTNTIFNSIWSLGTTLLKNLKNSLEENSPSKATELIGKNYLAGFDNGVEKNKRKLFKSIDNLGEEITSKLQNAVNIETGVINTNALLNSNANYNYKAQLNAQFTGDILMDKTKVGQLVTPVVSKTLKTAGVR